MTAERPTQPPVSGEQVAADSTGRRSGVSPQRPFAKVVTESVVINVKDPRREDDGGALRSPYDAERP